MSASIDIDRYSAAGFVLILLGGLLLVANGAVLGAIGAGYTYIDLNYYFDYFEYYFGESTAFYMIAIGVACGFFGLLVMTGAILVRMGYATEGGLVAIIFSTISLFLGGGFLAGTIFGILGGILAILER